MTARQIFQALQEIESASAQDAARAGFLEWALSLPEPMMAAQAADEALRRIGPLEAASPAARLFAGFLSAATAMPTTPPQRRRGRAGRLH